jgi:hypothetical protein
VRCQRAASREASLLFRPIDIGREPDATALLFLWFHDHDVKTHFDGAWTVQDRGNHYGAVLREREWRIGRPAVLLRTGHSL